MGAVGLVVGPTGENTRNALPDDLRELPELPWQTIQSQLPSLKWTDEETEAESTQYTYDTASKSIAILHTTGSTADPKPVVFLAKGLLAIGAICSHHESRLLMTPQSHGYSFAGGVLSLSGGSPIYIYPGAPYSLANLQKTIQIVDGKADNFCAVPMFIGLLLSATGGLEMLKTFKTVSICGGMLSEQAGQQLVDGKVGAWYSVQATEVGHMMDSGETKTSDWEWVSMARGAEKWMSMEPYDNSTYELVLKKGHPTLSVFDREDAYATRDLYVKHPTEPGKWKYWRRKDDILVHSSGMKTDPTSSEFDPS